MTLNKKLIAGIAAALPMVFFAAGSAFAADNNYNVELNGSKINGSAFEEYGTYYIPLRAVSEALGYRVDWSAKDNTVTMSDKKETIKLDLTNYSAIEGDHQYSIDDVIINGSTYLSEDFFTDSLGLKVAPDQAKKTIGLQKINENNIAIKTVKEASEEKSIDITLQYPQIDGLENQKAEDKINGIFKQAAAEAKNEGLSNIASADYVIGANKYETYLDYRVKYNQNNLLSVILLDYQYTGGAHGGTIQKGYTFDLRTGKQYDIKDLFRENSNYAQLFNGVVKDGIKTRELTSLTPFVSITDNQPYYLDNMGVSVYFQQYEYFPYAAGIQHFTADYSQLKEMLIPELNTLAQSGSK